MLFQGIVMLQLYPYGMHSTPYFLLLYLLNPLGSTSMWIPIVTFIGILQLKHHRKIHCLLFCAVCKPYFYGKRIPDAGIRLGSATKLVDFLGKKSHTNVWVKIGSEKSFFLLISTSVVLPEKHRESEFWSYMKNMRKKTFQSHRFLTYFV